jgi:hypothetical protein
MINKLNEYLEYLLVFHAYINKMHGSRSKIPSEKSRPYIYNVKFLALLGAPYLYDVSRLWVNHRLSLCYLSLISVFYLLAGKVLPGRCTGEMQ